MKPWDARAAGLQKEFGLGNFHDTPDQFGFDPHPFQRHRLSEELVEFLLPLPAIERPTGEKCTECRGDEEFCVHCRGDGTVSALSWESAHAAASSLAMFSQWLEPWNDTETSSTSPQLIQLRSYVRQGSAPLGGYYAIPFMQWLARYPVHTQFSEASAAMVEAYSFMFDERRDFMLRRIEAKLLHPGYLILDCPGDACGLHMSDHGNTSSEGAEFTCHNLDSPAQQITLLAGLAALHDQARQEGF